jgi:hypothetical protein
LRKADWKAGLIDLDLDRASAKGKLVRVYRKDGQQHGVLEITVDLPIKAMRDKTGKMTMRPGAAFRFVCTFDGCIDGSATAGEFVGKVTMSGTGTTISRGVQTVTEMDVRFTTRQTITPTPR